MGPAFCKQVCEKIKSNRVRYIKIHIFAANRTIIEDENEIFHPLVDNLVEFKVSCLASIATVGMGMQLLQNLFKPITEKLNGLSLLVIKSKKDEDGK